MGREWGVFWKGVCHGDVKSIPFLCPGLPSTSVPGQPSVTGARARCQHAGGSRPHSSRGLSRGGADVWRDFLYESYCAGNGEGRPAWVQVLDVETEPSLPWAGQFCSLGCSQRASVSPSHAFPPRGRGGSAGPTQTFTTTRWVVRGCDLSGEGGQVPWACANWLTCSCPRGV